MLGELVLLSGVTLPCVGVLGDVLGVLVPVCVPDDVLGEVVVTGGVAVLAGGVAVLGGGVAVLAGGVAVLAGGVAVLGI